MNIKFIVISFLIISCLRMVMVTDGSNLKKVEKVSLSTQSELDSLSILEDIYLPLITGRKVTNDELSQIEIYLLLYCANIYPSWETCSKIAIEEKKFKFKGDHFEFLKNILAEADPIIGDLCKITRILLGREGVEFWNCIVTKRREVYSCLKKLSLKSSLSVHANISPSAVYYYPSKEKIQDIANHTKYIFNLCDRTYKLHTSKKTISELNFADQTVFYNSLFTYYMMILFSIVTLCI